MDPHSLQAPSALLIENLNRFPKGTALDIACGSGRNALYLAAHGYAVEGIDRDPEALELLNAAAKDTGLSCISVKTDLEVEQPLPEKKYDLITCFYYLDRKIVPAMKSHLKIGGVLVYETFLIDQYEKFGKPGRKIFCWEHNELLQSFTDLRILFYFEGFKEDRWIAQLIAEQTRENDGA